MSLAAAPIFVTLYPYIDLRPLVIAPFDEICMSGNSLEVLDRI
jgi:hypothetical protein